MISIIITYKVNLDEIVKVKGVIKKFISQILDKEPGTVFYKSFQNKDDPESFIHIMTFKNSKAQEIHRNSEYCKKFVDELYPLCTDLPKAVSYEEIR